MADDPQDAETELDTGADDADATTSAEDTTDDAPADATDTKDTAGKTTPPAAKTTPVARKKVVSKRVTPKGGARPAASTATSRSVKKKTDDDDDVSFSSGRYTPPSTTPGAMLPSPWWVPALMFGLLILGALVIMLNYMGVFGEAENYRLIIGLVFILGGIITATQYR